MLNACNINPEYFKTEAVRNNDWKKLCRVIVYILQVYIRKDWVIRKNKGSITIQNPNDPKEVVTVLIDYGNRLSRKVGIKTYDDPVAVMVEICPQPEIFKVLLREKLENLFGNNYLKGEEYYIAPNREHHFDVVILPPGVCKDIDGAAYDRLLGIFSRREIGSEVRAGEIFSEGFKDNAIN